VSRSSPTPELPPDLGLAFRELAAARRASRWAWLATGTQTVTVVGLLAALGVGASARSGYWMVTAPTLEPASRVADTVGWRAVAAAAVSAALTFDEQGLDGLERAGDWLAPAVAARLREQLARARERLAVRPLTQTFVPVAVTDVDGETAARRVAATVVGYLLVAVPASGEREARVERHPYAVDLVAAHEEDGRWRVIRWEEVER